MLSAVHRWLQVTERNDEFICNGIALKWKLNSSVTSLRFARSRRFDNYIPSNLSGLVQRRKLSVMSEKLCFT